MASLSFEPLISPALWVTLALAAAALLLLYALRRPRGISGRRWVPVLVLMTLGIVAVMVVLLNPTWVKRLPPPPGKPVLTMLVDTSASMATLDAERGESRYASAAGLAEELAGQLDHRFDVQVQTFDATPAPARLAELPRREPQAEVTDLAAAVMVSLAQPRPQGQALVLLSDGVHNAPGGIDQVRAAVRVARAMAAPVYTRTFGREASVCDLEVELELSHQLAYIGQEVPIVVHSQHRGLAGGTANVTLLHEGEEIDRQQATLLAEGSSEVRFHVSRDEPGLYRYEVRVEPVPGEVTEANNTAPYVLHVVDEPIRVLLLEGKPYWDGKFLMRTLASDPSIALDSVVRMTADRYLRRSLSRAGGEPEASAGAPGRTGGGPDEPDATSSDTRAEEWEIVKDGTQPLASGQKLEAYQVIVLGRDAEHFLTEDAVENLRDWVARQGGSLVCYRGSPVAQVNQQLGRLLPVRWTPTRESRWRMELTDQGRDLNWLPGGGPEASGDVLEQLPTLATESRPGSPKPMAVVLAAAAEQAGGESVPMIVYQPYGMGRVVVVEGAGMWRWAFLPPDHQDHEEVYDGLWHSLLRWLVSSESLVPGQDMTLRGDKLTFRPTESATATLLMREEAAPQTPAIELTGDALDGVQRYTPVAVGEEPGMYRVTFGELPEGRYQARIAGSDEQDAARQIVFEVRGFSAELLNLDPRDDLMRFVADETGGAVLEADAATAILKQFEEHLTRTRPESVRRDTAWDKWWVLLAIMVVWATSWGLRRSGGLV